jgi:hypothetical protein
VSDHDRDQLPYAMPERQRPRFRISVAGWILIAGLLLFLSMATGGFQKVAGWFFGVRF